jgi:hypothetical protein
MVDDLRPWVEFLRTIGVQDGLSPQPIGRPNLSISQGSSVTATGLGTTLKLGTRDQALWGKAVAATGRRPNHPYTPYQLQGHLWRLPGQSDHASFPQRGKELYARLIVHGLPQWKTEHPEVTIKRPNRAPSQEDALTWPTLLRAFLALEGWVPMSVLRDRHTEVFCPPSAAWHFSEKGGDLSPLFAPLLPSDLRSAIDADPALRAALVELGLRVWNDGKDAKALVLHLGALVLDGEIAEVYIAPFKRAYEKAWTDVLQGGLGDPFAGAPVGAVLVVTTGHALIPLPVKGAQGGPNGTVVYVQGAQDTLAGRLLHNLAVPILAVGARTEAIAVPLLVPHFPHIKAVSSVDVRIVVDGQPFEPSDATPLLITSGLYVGHSSHCIATAMRVRDVDQPRAA